MSAENIPEKDFYLANVLRARAQMQQAKRSMFTLGFLTEGSEIEIELTGESIGDEYKAQDISIAGKLVGPSNSTIKVEECVGDEFLEGQFIGLAASVLEGPPEEPVYTQYKGAIGLGRQALCYRPWDCDVFNYGFPREFHHFFARYTSLVANGTEYLQ